MIHLHDIHKSFGALEVLKGIDLHIGREEVVSIVGPSGAGKTTLLQIMGTLYRPDRGTIEIAGTDVSRLSGNALSRFRCEHLGFIFQFHQLLPEFTALENVMIPAMIAHRSKAEARARALELLQFMGLADRAEQSKHKLEALDYFSRVRYYLRDAGRGKNEQGAEYRDLVYEVDEKGTGQFMAGVGASSIDSVYVYAEVQQTNFDLFAPGRLFRGGGQKGRLSVQAGPRIQTYEASVTEPYLFDRLLELTVEGYRRQRWYDEYDIIRTGAAASLAYPSKFWNPASLWNPEAEKFVTVGSVGFRLSTEFIEFDDIDNGTWEYKGREVSLKEEDRKYGDAFEPVIRVFWAHDTRNSNRIVTKGSRTQLYVDYAPAGDNQYYKLGFTHRSYFTTWEKYQHVLMVAFRAETIDGLSDDVPIYNRLFLGGPKSIRGIEYRGVSPYARKLNRDGDRTNKYDPWGGQTLVCANIEYTIPVFKMLRLAAFTDIGSVSSDEFDLSDDFAWTAGIGVRLDIPMFPVRLDFATPIEKPDHADEEVFSFTVGYDF